MYRLFVFVYFFCISVFPVTYTIASSINKPLDVLGEWNMFIINGINEDITFHVRSKEDDHGNHTLSYNGIYQWQIHETTTTYYWSQFWWGSKYQDFHVFDSRHPSNVCVKQGFGTQYCYWLVRPEGFYVSNVNNPFPSRSWALDRTWA